MNGDKISLTLKGVIDPAHLLQAIENSLSHSDETDHGVTGLTFRNYTITVHKRKGLSWLIECKFKSVPVEMKRGSHFSRARRRLKHDNDTKDHNSKDLR